MAIKQMYPFRSIEIKEGIDSQKPSLIFKRTPNPIIINNDNPPDAMINAGFQANPISRPEPPSSCRKPIRGLN